MASAIVSCCKSLPRFLALCALASIAGSASAASETYEISDLRFIGPSNQNGYPLPVDVLESGVVGHFRWSYTAGDFQNGTGSLLDLVLPITPLPLSLALTSATLAGLSGTAPANLHDVTYDFSIVFKPSLNGLGQTTHVGPGSSFDFTGNYGALSFPGEWVGQITAGTIAPVRAAVPEPGSLQLLTFGGAVLGCAARRRRTATRKRPRTAAPRSA